jgi:CheY-like chemotaxis protein
VKETAQLHQSLATTASLLEQRARERDQEIRRAEHANQAKDQFLAVLGHELRNPLAPALTALELMRARNPESSKREREVLERQIAHMTRLVNDLLDVSRLARGKTDLVRERFELHEAVDRAVDMVHPLIVQKGHTISVQVPARGLVIDGDSDRIVQVLSNLLTNAAKYTPANGRVSLSAVRVGGRVRIACEDTGPGIPAELVPRLFDAFAQGPRALDRREGGLGLGLALARSLTELHGGTISVEAVETGGSRFVVSLPIVTAVAESAKPADLPQRTVRANVRHILVVDDNTDAADMLCAALEDAGHHVAIAGSAPEAMHVAVEFRPDVGVLDIGLPDVNGYDLARQLRGAHAAIRLIALTGYGQASDVAAARNAGFDAHLAKPVSIASLLDVIAGKTVEST